MCDIHHAHTNSIIVHYIAAKQAKLACHSILFRNVHQSQSIARLADTSFRPDRATHSWTGPLSNCQLLATHRDIDIGNDID